MANKKRSSVAVIIINYNAGADLKICIKHLLAQTRRPDKAYVLDNNSTIKPIDSELLNNPEIIFIRLPENIGFAAGNNKIVDNCNTDYVALLNPDAFPEPDWLENLMDFADENQDIATLASRQVLFGEENIIDGVGDVYHFSGLVWRNGHGKPIYQFAQMSQEIFSPCAGAALFRTALFKEVGGFDEDFFCYVEDVDLGFRLRLAGYPSKLVNNAIVKHVGSATTGGKHSDFAVYHGHRNLVWAYVKNMPGWLFWLFLPLHLLMNIVAVIRFTLSGQGNVILRAKRDAILGLPKALRKRAVIQKSRKATITEIFRVLDKRIWPKR